MVPLPPQVNPVFPEVEKGLTAAEVRERKDEPPLRALDLLNRPACG